MIAHFIPVHRYPLQFKRLFRSIYLPGNQYVVQSTKALAPIPVPVAA